jgi:hypothetical protein
VRITAGPHGVGRSPIDRFKNLSDIVEFADGERLVSRFQAQGVVQIN